MNEIETRGSASDFPSADRSHGNSEETSGSREPELKEAALKSSSLPTVLVVEDDRNARKAITRILRLRGFVPLEAGSVREAMRALDPPPHWALLDLMLPDGCGSEVLDRITRDRLPTRVCITTGCAESRLNGLRERGASHILLKPLDVDRLLALLGDPDPQRMSSRRTPGIRVS